MGDVENWKFNLDRIINGLQSSDKNTKKEALQELSKVIDQTDSCNLGLLYNKISKVLTACLQDRLELCRENALIMLMQFLNLLEPQDTYLINLLPSIRKRFGTDKVIEESEEIRLLLVNLLNIIITKYPQSLIPYMEDLIEIFVKTISDTAPLVKRESCTCVIQLSALCTVEFHAHSKHLVAPLIVSTSHQHWRVRVAAIEAIEAAVQNGDNKLVPDAAVALAKRLFDDNSHVRLAVAKLAGHWLLNLPDRYSFFPYLLPLILTSLSDEEEFVREEANKLWVAAGRQYLDENEQDFKSRKDYGDGPLDHYPPGVKRPDLGCRVLVEREGYKFLLAAGKELTDWVLPVRIKSALLMIQLVLHLEVNVTQQLQRILPYLFKAAMDEEPSVITNVLKVSEYLGYFLPADVVARVVVSNIMDGTPGELWVLASILKGLKKRELTPQLPCLAPLLSNVSFKVNDQLSALGIIDSVFNVCEEESLGIGGSIWACLITNIGLAANDQVAHQGIGLLHQFVNYGRGNKFEIHNTYCDALLKRISERVVWTVHCHEQFMFSAIVDHAGEIVGSNVEEILDILKNSINQDSDPEVALKMVMATSRILKNHAVTLPSFDLCKFFIHSLIKDILDVVLKWKAGRTAEALRTAGTALLLTSLTVYYRCSEECLVKSDIKEDSVPIEEQNSKMFDNVEEPQTIEIQEEISDDLQPSAGPSNKNIVQEEDSTGESSSRNTELTNLSKGDSEDGSLGARLVPVLLSLAEDSAPMTRSLALRCLTVVAHEIVKPIDKFSIIVQAVLKRLDDCNLETRELSLVCISILYQYYKENVEKDGIDNGLLEFVYTTLLIHLDDQDPGFQIKVLNCLKKLSVLDKDLLRRKICRDVFRNKEVCDSLISHIQSI